MSRAGMKQDPISRLAVGHLLLKMSLTPGNEAPSLTVHTF